MQATQIDRSDGTTENTTPDGRRGTIYADGKNVTTKPDGNGLGLAMVYSILQAHRGSIRADSPTRLPADGSVAGGTTFTVRLPL